MDDAEQKGWTGSLTARSAKPEDVDAFLALARQACFEDGKPFAEGVARQVFAGIGRGEFVVHLLEAAGEVVGFAIVRYCRALIADATCVEQQLLFIRSDLRSAESELVLHSLAISLIQATNAAEAYLVVSPGPQAGDVIAGLANAGLGRFALRMSLATQPFIAPKPSPKQTDATLH